jgi:hypothetical protein
MGKSVYRVVSEALLREPNPVEDRACTERPPGAKAPSLCGKSLLTHDFKSTKLFPQQNKFLAPRAAGGKVNQERSET